ncbi:MAG TPA: S53 family peptidase [Gaiellaceae bacterium]|nr:S53 family peptidase [Gaiellaceae bacterium]
MKSQSGALAALVLVLATLAFGASAAAGANSGITATTNVPTTTLPADVVPNLGTYTDLGPVASDQVMNVVVPLQHDEQAIADYEASLNDPSSANYEQWLTPAQFQARFDAPAASIAAVRNFVTRDGLELYNTQGLGDLTLASGTAAQVERTFGVAIHNFQNTDGTHFYANVNAPLVPAGIGVVGVLGLQNLVQMKNPKAQPGPGNPEPQGQCVPGVNACTGLLGPTDLWSVYQQPSTDLGNGQSIGIIGEGQTADVVSALREFEKTRNLPVVPVQVYWTDPGPKTDDSGRIEWELDTQASTGMAPDVSQLRLYFGSDLSVGGLATSLQTWASDPNGPNQVNASIGICEDNPALDGLLGPAQTASSFALAQAATEGRAFFAATGDTGAGCAIGATAVNGVTYGPVESGAYPASDPNATGVGGTVLYTNGAATNPQRVDEHAWDHGGGTASHFIAQPAYQNGITALKANVCVSQPDGQPYPAETLCRGTADVSALSGDATVIVDGVGGLEADGYDMTDYDPSTSTYADHFAEGGTSLSSPLWAGMWARVNAAHANAQHKASPLGNANAVLYHVSATTPNAFFDVTEGANPLPATPGWDFPTGLGTPNLVNIIKAADNGNTKALSKAMPTGSDPTPIQAAGPSYGCPATFNDPNGDASSLPDSAPQLDILHGDVALSNDGSDVRAALTVANFTPTLPTGWTSADWIMYWTQPDDGTAPPATYTHDYYAVAATLDATGAVTYTDGTIGFDDSGDYQYTPVNTVTGSFVTGPNGRIEVDAPLADVGLASGTQMGTVGGATDEGDPATGLIVDTAAGGGSWTLGTTSCLG